MFPIMYKIIADIVFMCRIFAEIHARSILVSITGEVGLGRATKGWWKETDRQI